MCQRSSYVNTTLVKLVHIVHTKTSTTNRSVPFTSRFINMFPTYRTRDHVPGLPPRGSFVKYSPLTAKYRSLSYLQSKHKLCVLQKHQTPKTSFLSRSPSLSSDHLDRLGLSDCFKSESSINLLKW